MSLVFRANATNRQNYRSFEVAVIGGKQFSKKIFFIIAELPQIFFDNTKYIAIQRDKKIFFESDGLTCGTTQGAAFHMIFPGKILYLKKTSAIGSTKN